jgi:transcriptional regulator with XRE-family HTH domain
MKTSEPIGSRIRQVRRHHGLTQEEFGEQLGISKSSVINYESGKRTPDADLLIDLLRRFHVDAEWLMLGTTGKPGDKSPGTSNRRFPYPIDDEVVEMVEHLRIPAIKLSMMAEYERLKRVFAPLIREYREHRKNKSTG